MVDAEIEKCRRCLANSEMLSGQSLAMKFMSGEVSNDVFLKEYRPYRLGTICTTAQRVEAWLHIYASGKMPAVFCTQQILWVLGSLTSPKKVKEWLQ